MPTIRLEELFAATERGPVILSYRDQRLIVCREGDLASAVEAATTGRPPTTGPPAATPTDTAPVTVTVTPEPPDGDHGEHGRGGDHGEGGEHDQHEGTASADPPALTPRQHQVAIRLIAGASPTQIAGELGIALQTVRVHLAAVRHVYRAPNLATALAQLARDVLAAEEADPPR